MTETLREDLCAFLLASPSQPAELFTELLTVYWSEKCCESTL